MARFSLEPASALWVQGQVAARYCLGAVARANHLARLQLSCSSLSRRTFHGVPDCFVKLSSYLFAGQIAKRLFASVVHGMINACGIFGYIVVGKNELIGSPAGLVGCVAILLAWSITVWIVEQRPPLQTLASDA
jgi:hypothetical protein